MPLARKLKKRILGLWSLLWAMLTPDYHGINDCAVAPFAPLVDEQKRSAKRNPMFPCLRRGRDALEEDYMHETQSLKDFIVGARTQLVARVKDVFDPAYDPPLDSTAGPFGVQQYEAACSGLGKTLYQAQRDIVNALATGYSQDKKTLALIAEMGCGKTLMALMVAQTLSVRLKRPPRVLVLCPPTLVSTWKEEIQAVFGQNATIIDANGRDALSKCIAARPQRKTSPDQLEVWLMGFNRAKLNHGWKPEYWKVRKPCLYEDGVEAVTRLLCPHCGLDVQESLKPGKRSRCQGCNAPLWGPDGNVRRYAPALYIKKRLKGFFDFLICDEVHQLKGGDTIQGAVLGQLAGVCQKTLLLTGTLSGGKASDIFYILQRAMALNYDKETRKAILPDFAALTDFVGQYGTIEEIFVHNEDDRYYGRSTKPTRRIKEKPGISPLALRQYFIENTAFMRLSDIASKLPGFREELEFTTLPDDVQRQYKRFEKKLVEAVKQALRKRDFRVLGQMLSNLLAWPDAPQEEARVLDRENTVVASAPAMDIERTPKDERLVEILRECRKARRKALVFVEYTGKWRMDARLAARLREAGLNPLVLKATVPAAKRLQWIRTHLAQGDYDCLICQPRLVEVGLNLLEFPEVIFFQTGFSTYVLRQASRRSYRPGQAREVVIRYMINEDTLQEQCMSLIASKLEASLILEGELSDKGLVALSESGESMAVELARALVGELKTQSLEARFAAYKQAETDSGAVFGYNRGVDIAPSEQPGKRQGGLVVPTNNFKLVKVGEAFSTPGADKLAGKIHRRKIELKDGRVFCAGKVVGSYSKEGEFHLTKERSRMYVMKPSAAVLPGFEGVDIFEIKKEELPN